MSSKLLNEVCGLLETYKGRDKIIRTLCYTAKLIGALSNDVEIKKKFQIFSSQMSKTRATLRLFDDLPMLKYSLEYGMGKEEPDGVMSAIGVTSNLIDTLFYPIEKVSWLAEYELISTKGDPWDVASSVCWVATVYLSIMKTLRYFCILQTVKSNHKLDGKTLEISEIAAKEKLEYLSLIRLILDFIHAVHTLPAGFLWSSQLNAWQVGLVGTLSSVLGIYQIFAKRSLTKALKNC